MVLSLNPPIYRFSWSIVRLINTEMVPELLFLEQEPVEVPSFRDLFKAALKLMVPELLFLEQEPVEVPSFRDLFKAALKLTLKTLIIIVYIPSEQAVHPQQQIMVLTLMIDYSSCMDDGLVIQPKMDTLKMI